MYRPQGANIRPTERPSYPISPSSATFQYGQQQRPAYGYPQQLQGQSQNYENHVYQQPSQSPHNPYFPQNRHCHVAESPENFQAPSGNSGQNYNQNYAPNSEFFGGGFGRQGTPPPPIIQSGDQEMSSNTHHQAFLQFLGPQASQCKILLQVNV